MEAAVTRVKTMGLARFFHPTHGRSALRFGHTLDEALGLDAPRLALRDRAHVPRPADAGRAADPHRSA